jgi:hypothetical protein
MRWAKAVWYGNARTVAGEVSELIRLAADEIGVERPRLVTPRRDSGPRVLPDGWHLPEQQRRICVLCSLLVIGQMSLHEGKWCGNCYHFSILPGRASKPELPPAA